METERTDNILNELNSTACISDLKSDIIKYIPTKRFQLKAPTICR